ncbi:hypothetical protein D9M69_687750 [compost metagenome]
MAGIVKSPSTVRALPSAIELFGTIDKLRSPPKRSFKPNKTSLFLAKLSIGEVHEPVAGQVLYLAPGK